MLTGHPSVVGMTVRPTAQFTPRLQSRVLAGFLARARGLWLGSECREYYERSVATSFNLNGNVSLLESTVDAIAQGAKKICGLD